MERLVDWRLVTFAALLMLTPYLMEEMVQRSVKSDALARCAEPVGQAEEEAQGSEDEWEEWDEQACRRAVEEHHRSCWNRARERRGRRGCMTRDTFPEGFYLECVDKTPEAISAANRQGRRNAAENRRILRDPGAFQ